MNDKSELIDEVLGKLAEDLINYDQRMIKAKAPNVRFVHKYTKEAKATLQKAFREVEIEGRIEELDKIDKEFEIVYRERTNNYERTKKIWDIVQKSLLALREADK